MPTRPPDLVALALERAADRFAGRCWYSRLPDEHRAQVAELCAMPMRDMPHTVVAGVIRDVLEVDVSDFTVAHHRKGRCRCAR